MMFGSDRSRFVDTDFGGKRFVGSAMLLSSLMMAVIKILSVV